MANYEKEAKKAMKDGDYLRAGDLFVMAGKEDKGLECYLKGKHYEAAGRLLERMGDYYQAARYYKMGSRFNEAAEMMLKTGDKNQALKLLEQAQNWSKAKELALSLGDIAKAAYYAEQAQQIEQAASLYAKAGNYHQAAMLFEKIVQLMLKEKEEKGYFQSWIDRLKKYSHNAAVILEMLQENDKAAYYYHLAGNYKAAGNAYLKANAYEKAIESFAKAKEFGKVMEIIETHPELEVSNPIDFAESCFSAGKYKEAAKYFLIGNDKYRAAESLEKAGDHISAAQLFMEVQDYEKAVELYLKAEAWEKAAAVFELLKNWGYAADLYLRINKKEDAIRALASAEEYYKASLLLLEMGKQEEALAYLQKVPPDHSDFDTACLLLAEEFIKINMPSIAIQKIKEALQGQALLKDNIDYYYTMAKAYEAQNEIDEALKIYERILALDLTYKDVKERINSLKEKEIKIKEASISSRFKIIDQILSEPNLSLYKAIDTLTNQPVILKKIPYNKFNSAKQYIEITSKLNHKNIAKIYETLADNEYGYITMEYLEGETLKSAIDKGFNDFARVKDIVEQICQALSIAHQQNIIHKNLCPENIFINNDNMVKILNFDTPLYAMPQISADYLINYKAPEQFEGLSLDIRADIFSLGIIIYEMIYRKYPQLPLDPENKDKYFPLTSWNIPIPEFIKNIIIKCLMSDRKYRYNSIEEIIADLSLEEICPGMTLGGRYEIIQEVGSGGMGKVYKARDRDLEEIVALKVLKSDFSQNSRAQERFIREIKLTRKISHPNVVKVYDTGFFKGHRYISMEFIDGESLDKIIAEKGKMQISDAIKIALQICSAISFAHSLNIIHRDLKPANVMITKSNIVKILDFGIAKAEGIDNITTTGNIIGSPKYMAPEQIHGFDIDQRTDLYAFGIILYCMLTGVEPFADKDQKTILMKQLYEKPQKPSYFNPDIPQWLDELILSLLEKNKENRPSSANAVISKIKEFIK